MFLALARRGEAVAMLLEKTALEAEAAAVERARQAAKAAERTAEEQHRQDLEARLLLCLLPTQEPTS